MLIDIADAIINFYVLFVKRGRNIYEDMKKKAFENKLIYYARYDMNQNRYLVVYNYDKVLSVFYFYMFNYIWKMSYASMTYLDLDFAFDNEIIVVTQYVRNKQIYNKILDYALYKSEPINIKSNVVFACSDTETDLTHEFEKFKTTIFQVAAKIGTQHIYNILMGYKRLNTNKISNIKIMMDNNFEEIVI